MTGPACSVLAPLPCSAHDLIEELVGLTGSMGEKYWYWVEDTHTIGGTYKGNRRPFIWFQEPRDPRRAGDDC